MDRTHLMEWWDSDGLDYTSVQQSLQPSHPRASLTFQPLPGLRRPMVDGNGSHHSRRKTGMYQNPKVSIKNLGVFYKLPHNFCKWSIFSPVKYQNRFDTSGSEPPRWWLSPHKGIWSESHTGHPPRSQACWCLSSKPSSGYTPRLDESWFWVT